MSTELARAAELVIDTRLAAVTFVQRKLHVTFARAAWLLDELEVLGVVGPRDGSRARDVLAPPERMAEVLERVAIRESQ